MGFGGLMGDLNKENIGASSGRVKSYLGLKCKGVVKKLRVKS